MERQARYDGLADWYDAEFYPAPLEGPAWEAVVRLLGEGRGELLDVGCGTGAFAVALRDLGWSVTGVDIRAWAPRGVVQPRGPLRRCARNSRIRRPLEDRRDAPTARRIRSDVPRCRLHARALRGSRRVRLPAHGRAPLPDVVPRHTR